MDYKKRVLYSFVFAIVLVFVSALVSAGLKDFFFSPEASKDVSVSFTGTNPVQVIIHNETLTGLTVQPEEYGPPASDGFKEITFIVELIDQNGAADINESATNSSFDNGGTTRSNSSCVYTGDSTVNSKNFSCTIGMWYFDTNAIWTITAGGRDLGNTSYQETVSTFLYGSLRAFDIDGSDIQFPALSPGATNVASTNDPTFINNTGNYVVPRIDINSTDLPGVTQPSSVFGVGNFSASVTSGLECSGDLLQHGVLVALSGSGFSPGNLSAGNGQQTLYYCIPSVPSNLLTQDYSTSVSGTPWVIDIP